MNFVDKESEYAMVVDAIDEGAEHFYKRYGFSLLAHGGNRLFLPLKPC